MTTDITTSSGLFYRVRHTPMRDVLRGRLTGRLDIKQHIAQSDLPQTASDLIQRVIRRTRLRPLEKVDVANELIAHFSDGLESGKTIDQLIKSFGDERQAARLISRAKRRNRSILGRTPTIIGRAAISIAVVYTLIGLYFFNGKPSGSVTIERLSEYAQQFPEDQRAWPFYQKGIAAWNAKDSSRAAGFMREAAIKPAIGFIDKSGHYESLASPMFHIDPFAAGDTFTPPPEVVEAISISLEVLPSDADQSWMSDRPDLLISDINAMDQMCRQWHSDRHIHPFVPAMMFREELKQIDRALNRSPEMLGNADLQNLASQIARYRIAADLVNLQCDQIEFEQWLGKYFTDDHNSSGRITSEGLSDVIGADQWMGGDPIVRKLSYPSLFLFVPSRARISGEFNKEFEQARRRLSMPYRSADWESSHQQLDARNLLFDRLRLRTNAYDLWRRCAAAAEDQLGHRDGILVGIALEQYRRANKTYPTSLDQLVPAFLREIPVSRVTGEPLSYRLVKDKPIVYSVGHADWMLANYIDADGNWILYPRAGY